jgi:hypothetical protein
MTFVREIHALTLLMNEPSSRLSALSKMRCEGCPGRHEFEVDFWSESRFMLGQRTSPSNDQRSCLGAAEVKLAEAISVRGSPCRTEIAISAVLFESWAAW